MTFLPVDPPVAERRPFVRSVHEDRRDDPYAWLEDRHDPATLRYLRAENAYSRSSMRHTGALQQRLFAEFRERSCEDDVSAAVSIGGWLYYSRTRRGLDYAIYCRRQDAPGAAEEIILDVNRLADGKNYCDLGTLEVSPDHRRLLYTVDFTGSERYTLRVLDLDGGELLADVIDDVDDALWLEDGRHIVYTPLDRSERPHAAWLHRLGGPSDDFCLFVEQDPAYFLHLGRTQDRRFVLLVSESHTTSEVRLMAASGQSLELRLFRERQVGVEYALEHWRGEFFVLTNDGAPNFRLLRMPASPHARAQAQEMVVHDPLVRLEGMDVFREYLALYTREDGLCGVRVCHLPSGVWHQLAVDAPLTSVFPGANPVFETRVLRLVFDSYTEPARTYDYDMAERCFSLRKRDRVPTGHKAADYAAERLQATAPDGTAVPVSIVYRRGLRASDYPAPCLLSGYGAYGESLDPEFSVERLSLLDRGFVVAEAHVRGGGELGERWRACGRGAYKENSFDDFIAVAELLCARGITAPERLAIAGASAGGLLVGAVLNRRPDLFSAALAEVPFVDVLNTMLDPDLPLTVIEYDEWGDPRRAEDYFRIKAYAPYEQVRAQAYPALLATAGFNDARVPYWEAAKWVAELRHCQRGAAPILLHTELTGGHGGTSGRYRAMRDQARHYAFVIDRVGHRQ